MKKILFAIVSLIVAVGCTTEEAMPTVLGLDPVALTLSAKADESKEVQVLTNAVDWSAAFASATDWCELAVNGNFLTVTTLTENTDLEPRTAVIVITADGKTMELPVEQSGAATFFKLENAPENNLVLLAQNGTGESAFTVLSNMGEWTATLAEGGDAWCNLVVTADGFTLSPKAPNFSSAKNEAKLTIALKKDEAAGDEAEAEEENNDIVLTVKQWCAPDFSAGGEITLSEDCVVNSQIVITAPTVLNLNGFTLTSSENVCDPSAGKFALIQVDSYGELEIGGGSVVAKEGDGYALACKGGSAMINSGEFVGNATSLYVLAGMAIIQGGDFYLHDFEMGDSSPKLIDCEDQYYAAGYALVYALGGYFYGYNPGAEGSEVAYYPYPGYIFGSIEVVPGSNIWAVLGEKAPAE